MVVLILAATLTPCEALELSAHGNITMSGQNVDLPGKEKQ